MCRVPGVSLLDHEVRGHKDARRHGGGGLYRRQCWALGWGDLPSGPSCVTSSPHLTVSASSSSSLVIPHPHLPSKPVPSGAWAAPVLPTQDVVQWNGRVTAPMKTDLTALGYSGQKRYGFFHTSIPRDHSLQTLSFLDGVPTVLGRERPQPLFAPVIPDWSPMIKLGMAAVWNSDMCVCVLSLQLLLWVHVSVCPCVCS